MPTVNPRVNVTLTESEHDRLLEYQHEHHIQSASKAILDLIERGLKSIQQEMRERDDEEIRMLMAGSSITGSEAELLSCYRRLNEDGQHSLLTLAKMHAQNEDFLKDAVRKMA